MASDITRLKIALVAIDIRAHDRAYHETQPRFGTGVDSMIAATGRVPEMELHVLSCTQRPMQSPAKLADNIWFHSLHVPKIGWLRTGYQGCIRAVRRQVNKIQPDLVHGEGTERHCAVSVLFSGFPNVVAIAGNTAELARLSRARIGSYAWLSARLENYVLPRTDGVICNSRYTEGLVRPRAKRVWLIYPGLRSIFLQPPAQAGPRQATLMVVGVISARKRQLELLELAETLHRRGLKFQFQFAGPAPEAPYTASFLQRIKPMEAAGYAIYLGFPSHAELVRRFDAASGMIHFPTEEAFGSVVAEAFARDLKFFGSRAGGIVEIATGMPGAELFSPDDWNGLADAVSRWLQAGYPSGMGASVIARERYHPDVYVRQHLDVYREVLRQKKV